MFCNFVIVPPYLTWIDNSFYYNPEILILVSYWHLLLFAVKVISWHLRFLLVLLFFTDISIIFLTDIYSFLQATRILLYGHLWFSLVLMIHLLFLQLITIFQRFLGTILQAMRFFSFRLLWVFKGKCQLSYKTLVLNKHKQML